MLDSFFSKGFKASKCKTLLKLTIPRIKLLRNRRDNQIKQMRREIVKLLETGQEATARIRVEHIIREEKMMAAQEIVELFCELITAHLPIIDAQKECPLDLKEALSSVCFAAPRCADLPELQQVQMLFAGKYGKEFVSSAAELMPECGVSRQLVELLSVRAPSPDVKLKLLKEIAKEHELDWDPSASENELLKTHEDFLNGPIQFVSGREVPLPKAHDDEAKSITSEPAAGEHPDSDEDFEIIDFPEVPMQPLPSNRGTNSAPEMLPFPASALSEVDELEEQNPSSVKEDKQFVPFIRPPSQLSVPFPVKQNISSPSVTKTINNDADLEDVLTAAHAAADTAESAATAARSASSLAQLRITELMKRKNDDFSCSEAENPFHLDETKSDLQEEADLDAENPFAHSNTPFPGRNSNSVQYMAYQTTNLHTSDDIKEGFHSFHQRDDAFSYGSLDHTRTQWRMQTYESSDVSQKEQLALCLRYVEGKTGKVVERFLGLVHVSDTTALSLKSAIISLLVEHSLSPSKIRRQGYDGASNMKGEIHGLKTLIRQDTPSAYYVHCFAHQLQLTLVAIAKKNNECAWLFDTIASLLNVVGVSCKRREMIREFQAQNVAQALEVGELETGSGLNQELGLKRPVETRWSSHYKTILNVLHLFSTIMKVLVMIGENGSNSDDKAKAQGILYSFESFEFVFMAQLMSIIFGYTNDLCLALQRNDQDIVNAMRLVTLTKVMLQKMRENGWETHLKKVISFCNAHEIIVPDMEARYIPQGRSRHFVQQVSYLHHFRVDVFIEVIDLLLQELENRFDEVSTELLMCMICLNPNDGFSSFDKEKVPKLATFYPSEFSSIDLMSLECQIDMFIEDMKRDDELQNLQDVSSLSMKLVETNRHVTYHQVFLLIKLLLILPVATASVERAFSGMTYVKNKLRNSMGDQFLNDYLVTSIEREIFLQVSDDEVATRFQQMKTRRKIN